MSRFKEHRLVPESRPLNSYEQRLLDAFVARLEEEAIACQARLARVRARCEVGCYTVLLDASRERCPPSRSSATVPIEASGLDADGMDIAFLLFLQDGYVEEIEVVRGDSGRVIELPEIESLQFSIVGGIK